MLKHSHRTRAAVVMAVLWLVTAFAVAAADIKAERQERRTWHFSEGDVWFSNEFSGARLNDCVPLGPDDFAVVISPENTPINPSPWYAFKIWSSRSRMVRLQLSTTFEGRILQPRISRDGVSWRILEADRFMSDRRTKVGTAKLDIGPQPLWVAAQEMIGMKELNDWSEGKAGLRFARTSVIAESVEGRPIQQFTLGETTNANYVFIIGRQHPPEITGTIGLMSFVDALAGNARLAREYRRHFRTVVVPLLNPDGVEHGQWRSNLGGKDLNRDWREFAQPEPREVSRYLQALASQPGARPFLFLDFHSTRTNIFYAQPDDRPMQPFAFTGRWLNAIHARDARLRFDRDNDHNSGQATAKAWAHETFGIPAVTVEYGYNSDRAAIRRSARIAAEEMMRLLLAELKNPFAPTLAGRHNQEPAAQAQ